MSSARRREAGLQFDNNFFASQKPLLKLLTLSAAEIVGQQLKKGVVVVLESTIYPGVSEEIIAPILDLENESGLKCGADFKIGYSPERINPGDEAHTLDKIMKVVSEEYMDGKIEFEDMVELIGIENAKKIRAVVEGAKRSVEEASHA